MPDPDDERCPFFYRSVEGASRFETISATTGICEECERLKRDLPEQLVTVPSLYGVHRRSRVMARILSPVDQQVVQMIHVPDGDVARTID